MRHKKSSQTSSIAPPQKHGLHAAAADRKLLSHCAVHAREADQRRPKKAIQSGFRELLFV